MKKTILILGIIFLLAGISISPSVAVFNSKDDTTPPVTWHELHPPEPPYENGWYRHVQIEICAEDNESGVNYKQIKLNGGSTQIIYGGRCSEILFDTDGNNSISYSAIDNAGNIAPWKSFYVKTDLTKPHVNLVYEVKGKGKNGGWIIEFTATATDSKSGMDRVEFYLNDVLQDTVNGSGPTYQWSFIYNGGLNISITAGAFDNVGNKALDEVSPKIKNINLQQSINPIFIRFLDHFPLLHRILDIWRHVLV
ncbi:hypothetical protein AYK24_03805 [Thermoplasmatales archaeon SG8-52-4]|nr:MAG: hypothetical protein AYK24_03805 [Thermoplasmatales archaeon SG8-52-4]